jgi:hypothetical protein
MKERPILFSAPMVRAILDGTKMQTRRVLKQATGPSLSVGMDDEATGVAELSWLYGDGPGYDVHETIKRVSCPYGQATDRLWVRESFWGCDLHGHGDQPCVVYDDEWHGKEYSPAAARPWARKFGRIPSIHMPRDCSRITLEITDVRVDRLQDISEADAIAEGAPWAACCAPQEGSHKAGFAKLWESINGAGSWDKNPWLWVIEFKRVNP